MVKSELTEVRTYIHDKKIWDCFLDHVKKVYGRTHGYTGIEVQNALKQYLENYGKSGVLKLQNKLFKQDKTIKNQKKDIVKLKKLVEELKKANTILQTETEVLHKAQDNYSQLHEEHFRLQDRCDKLRNKHDHLQERFNKSQGELNVLERENSQLRVVVAKIEKLSFFERVFNRLPSEVKQLTTNKVDDIEL
jgi:DNA repair ATPase RecN